MALPVEGFVPAREKLLLTTKRVAAAEMIAGVVMLEPEAILNILRAILCV